MFSADQVYRALDIAAERLGYSNLKEEQKQSIQAFFFEKRDVFVSPTNWIRKIFMFHSSSLGVRYTAGKAE